MQVQLLTRPVTRQARTKPYYDQVLEKANSVVKHYRDDLLKHDKNALEGYNGDFIHMTRGSGTYLLLLHPPNSPRWAPKGVKVPYLFGWAGREHMLEGYRAYFDAVRLQEHELVLYGHNGAVVEIKRERAKEIVESYITRTLNTWRKI